uniref:Uncharacterized protein n=1 Tax=virus sp. ctBM815 TaxID=2825806 RepID=A0A8S5RKS6_9VIRU|nr:MAG TPA: hypothetical protein [virus sp. ctBM815]DAH83044.1 MAG TPA: hypothetical protein [Bacteriophage sp.]DAV23992.1 MAG TPA: hypothetical protein [Bacteriophage sp.]
MIKTIKLFSMHMFTKMELQTILLSENTKLQ